MTFTSKAFKRVSFCVYLLAFLGLASIVFEASDEQPLRFQYRDISPDGLVRTIIDYIQLIALLVLMLNAVKNFQFNKILVVISIITYSLFILIDVNTWLFYTNEDILYAFIIAVESLPLVLFFYQSHMFKKEFKGVLITGIIGMLIGFLSHFYFYHLAATRGYRGGFYYDYPALMKLMGWFSFAGTTLAIVAAMEAVNNYRYNRKNQQLTLVADNDEQL
jgi:hypothetical protein